MLSETRTLPDLEKRKRNISTFTFDGKFQTSQSGSLIHIFRFANRGVPNYMKIDITKKRKEDCRVN